MNLKQLHYFMVISDLGSFSSASRQLFIAQPSLTRQIRQLENKLEAPLFIRKSVGIELTEAGRILYKDSKKMFEQLESTQRKIKEISLGNTGTLELGTTALHLRTTQVAKLLQDYRLTYPDTKLSVNAMLANKQLERLYQLKLDAGIFYYPPEDPKLNSISINRDRLVLVTHKDSELALNPARCLNDLKAHNFIWFDRSSSKAFYDVVFSYFTEVGFKPESRETGNTSATIMSLVSSGHGYTLMPEKVVEQLSEPIIYYPLDDLLINLQLKLVWLKKREAPQIVNLVKLVQSSVNQTD